MPLPINIDLYSKLIVLDENELIQKGVATAIRERLQRLRALYAYWLKFPGKTNNEVVEYNIKMFKIGRSQAYDDLRLTQVLLGSMQQASKEFMRWKINQDLEHDLSLARDKGDMRAVASIEKARIQNNRTDKDEEQELEFDKIVPQQFVPTDDPTVIGITKVAGLREKIRKLERKYRQDLMEDTQYEEVTADE